MMAVAFEHPTSADESARAEPASRNRSSSIEWRQRTGVSCFKLPRSNGSRDANSETWLGAVAAVLQTSLYHRPGSERFEKPRMPPRSLIPEKKRLPKPCARPRPRNARVMTTDPGNCALNAHA
jgi:hypothetical protein